MAYRKLSDNGINLAAAGDESHLTKLERYRAFIKRKAELSRSFGLDVDPEEIHPILHQIRGKSGKKSHQPPCVRWMVRGGRRALFASFGLGKTLMQLETLRLVLKKAKLNRPALIVAPLGVRQEFRHDAQMVDIKLKFVRSNSEVDDPDGIFLTNYETVRDGKLDVSMFGAISLDEAAILRSFGKTLTFRSLTTACEPIPYRFVATATPDPNEYIEILAYAAFLGIMDVSQGKTRFFKRDSTKADKLSIHPHKETEWWLWNATWALYLSKPSDLGPEYSDEGYDLPAMEVIHHEIRAGDRPVTADRGGQYRLVPDSGLGVVDAAREKRQSIDERILGVKKILYERVICCDRKRAEREASGDGRIQDIPAQVSTGVVSQSSQRDESSPRKPGEKSIHAGISPAVLPGEQRKDSAARTGLLQQEQREDRRAVKSVETCESRTLQRSHEELFRPEPGTHEETQPRVVRSQQRTRGSINETQQVAALWNECGGSVGDTKSAEGTLRDMPSANDDGHKSQNANGCGSLSQERETQGIALSDVQRSLGGIPRRSEDSETSDNLPQFIVWCDLNYEQKEISRALDDLKLSHVSLYGDMPIEEREDLLRQWRSVERLGFVSKPMMYGSGVNLQQCWLAIFAGISFKFAEFVQAIARILRFLQTHPVEIHLVYTEYERGVVAKLMQKWERYKTQVQKMSEIIKEHGLAELSLAQALARGETVERFEIIGENYTLVNNDSVLETIEHLPDNSAHLILTSIPFSTQYEYSPNLLDMGHTDDNAHFWEQMDFLIPELLRVLAPGRLAAIHVKDRIVPGGLTGRGFQTVYPFHVDAILGFMKHGFGYMGMKTIVTDVVRENNQTYRLGWSEQCKDGTKMGVGMPEYLLIFRKNPTDNKRSYADAPVVKLKRKYSRSRWQIDAHGFTRSNGNRLLTPEEIESLPHASIFKIFRDFSLNNVYDFEHHVHLGEALEHWSVNRGVCECNPPEKCRHGRLPVTFMLLQPASWHPDVWTDITRMMTLNGAQSAKGREPHLCPLQFDLADRVIMQYTQEGETVLDPFAGLCTVAYRAIKLKRKAVNIELNRSYLIDGSKYCEAAAREVEMPSLFDICEPDPAIQTTITPEIDESIDQFVTEPEFTE